MVEKRSAIGAYSAFAGISGAVAEIGKVKLGVNRGLDYFNKLNADEEYELLPGKKYTPGMTIPQVRELFEYDASGAKKYGVSNIPLPKNQADYWRDRFGLSADAPITNAMIEERITSKGRTWRTGERQETQKFTVEEREQKFIQDIVVGYALMSDEEKKRLDNQIPTLLNWAIAMSRGEDVEPPKVGKIPGWLATKYPSLAEGIASLFLTKPGIVPGGTPQPGGSQLSPADQKLLNLFKSMPEEEKNSLINEFEQQQGAGTQQIAPPGGVPPGMTEDLQQFPQGSQRPTQAPGTLGSYNPGKLEMLGLLRNAKLKYQRV